MSNKTVALTETLHAYLLQVSLREPELLARLRRETARLPQANMQIAPEQGQLLSLLVRLMGATRAIELGVFTGYSALCIALAMPPHGRLIACDINREWTDVARRYWEDAGLAERIDLRLQPARATLEALLAAGESGSFDFLFLDADKTSYRDYYELGLELLRPGGLMVVDNVLWSGKVADPDNREPDTLALRAFNDALRNDSRVLLSMLPVADGLTLAVKL